MTDNPHPAQASAERMVLVSERLLHDTLALFDSHPSGHWVLAPGADVGDVAEEINAALVPPLAPAPASAAEALALADLLDHWDGAYSRAEGNRQREEAARALLAQHPTPPAGAGAEEARAALRIAEQVLSGLLIGRQTVSPADIWTARDGLRAALAQAQAEGGEQDA